MSTAAGAQPGVVEVRRERRGDEEAVAEVHRLAFARAGEDPPIEVTLLARLRNDPAWLPHLSLVAIVDGERAGHVVATRAWVNDAPALGLGPVGVRPERQRAGIGTILVHALVAVAETHGETLVGLLGDPRYYRRFGFTAATDVGIEPPDPQWGPFFQVRSLVAEAIPGGRFRYAPPFGGLG